jgi:hypothetical protein
VLRLLTPYATAITAEACRMTHSERSTVTPAVAIARQPKKYEYAVIETGAGNRFKIGV